MKFDHIGIFVEKLSVGRKHLNNILTIKKKSREIIDKKMKIKVQFLYDQQNIKYEIIAPFGKGNPIKNSISKKKNIINHLAYKVNNLDKKIMQLRNNKFIPISKIEKAKAFNGSRVIFLMSKLNFIIELIENK